MTIVLAANPAVRAIGIALIGFVLQGAIIGAVVALLLALCRRGSAHLRYLVACAGLAAMAMMPVVTAARQWTPVPGASTTFGPDQHQTIRTAPDTSSSVSSVPEAGWRSRLVIDRVAPVVVVAWIAGVIVLTARLFGGWLQVVRIRRRVRLPRVPEWSRTVTRLARRLQIKAAVPLFESTLVGLPVVIGWLRPAILIPAGVFASLTPDQIEAILAHELAHIRRGDYVVNALQRVVEIVLFYHPAVWWVSACMRREREHCCDDLAAPLSSSRLTYAHALVALEERRGRAPALAMAATGSRSGFFARIRRIVDPSSTVDSTLPKGAVMTIVSSVIALVLTGAVSVGHASPTLSSGLRPTASVATSVDGARRPSTLSVNRARAVATPAVVPNATPSAQALASIRGTVSDQQDGRVPGATIAVDPIGRAGATRTAMSDATGQFAVTDLPEGAYLVTVTLPGFRRDERRVDIRSGVALTANVQLKVGSVQEAMTVVSGRQAVPTQEARPSTESVGGLLDAAKQATDAGRLADAEASLRAALAVLRAAQPAPPASSSGAVRVGGDIKPPRQIRNVPPVYPQAARAAGIQGIVIIEATIDRDGSVADAAVLRGVPELNGAALDAVRQWVYTPTLLGGVPVPVLMTVTVAFTIR